MREADGLLLNYGGKSRIAHKLVPHFPRGPSCFVDLFFGGGGVFFSVPEQLYKVQVINDLNRSVVTFYKVLRERPEELLRLCSLTPYAFDEQRSCRNTQEDPDDELETARRVWVRQRQNFGGRQHSAAGWRRGSADSSAAAGSIAKLDEFARFARRMLRVEINNTDAIELARDYSKPGVFLYADPPYLPETRETNNDYEHEMSKEQHEQLARVLHDAVKSGAHVAISGYNSSFYAEMYKDWRKVEYMHQVSSANFATAEQRTRTECMWMSYPAELEIGPAWQPPLRAGNSQERAILKHLSQQRRA